MQFFQENVPRIEEIENKLQLSDSQQKEQPCSKSKSWGWIKTYKEILAEK